MLWFSCSISSTSNNILCISMKQKNLGNVISVIMLMHYKRVFKSTCETVIQKKAISKFVTSVVTRPQSTTTWKNTLSVLTRKKDGSPVTCAMHISIAKALWNATSEVIFLSSLKYSKRYFLFSCLSSLSKELDPFDAWLTSLFFRDSTFGRIWWWWLPRHEPWLIRDYHRGWQ